MKLCLPLEKWPDSGSSLFAITRRNSKDRASCEVEQADKKAPGIHCSVGQWAGRLNVTSRFALQILQVENCLQNAGKKVERSV